MLRGLRLLRLVLPLLLQLHDPDAGAAAGLEAAAAAPAADSAAAPAAAPAAGPEMFQAWQQFGCFIAVCMRASVRCERVLHASECVLHVCEYGAPT